MQQVAALEGREHLRITFPKLDGYRVELPDEDIWLDLDNAPVFEIGPNTVPRWVEMSGVVGAARTRGAATRRDYRPKQVAFALAKRILDAQFNTVDDKRPWLFPRLVADVPGLDRAEGRARSGDYSLGYLMTITEAQADGRRAGLERDHSAGRATAASGCAR